MQHPTSLTSLKVVNEINPFLHRRGMVSPTVLYSIFFVHFQQLAWRWLQVKMCRHLIQLFDIHDNLLIPLMHDWHTYLNLVFYSELYFLVLMINFVSSRAINTVLYSDVSLAGSIGDTQNLSENQPCFWKKVKLVFLMYEYATVYSIFPGQKWKSLLLYTSIEVHHTHDT